MTGATPTAATCCRARIISSTRSSYLTASNRPLSPASATFVVAPGNIPQVSLPTLPPGATGYNIYLSDPVANPGSATLYSRLASRRRPTTSSAMRSPGDVVPPALNFPTAAPTVAPAGGGTTGGQLAPGTYILSYTFVNAAGAETYASPYSAPFTVTAGQIPQVTLPPLPGGVSPGATTAYNIYLSGPTADPTSVIRYAPGSRRRPSTWRSPRRPATQCARRSPRLRPWPRWCRPWAAARPAANWRRAPISSTTPTPTPTAPRRPRARIPPTSPWPPDISRS